MVVCVRVCACVFAFMTYVYCVFSVVLYVVCVGVGVWVCVRAF